ncbi:MAG: HK97 family phage prohead protease [Holosporales bacterium]
MLVKTLPLDTKSLDDQGIFRGYASVFNVLDHQGDRVLKGAFQASLSRRMQEGNVPKMLWQHDPKEPIGIWRTLREDNHGLFVEGRLLMNVRRAQEAYALLKTGVIQGLSIGFTIEDSARLADGVRYLKSIDLHEISLVTFAANQAAKVLGVKHAFPVSVQDNRITADRRNKNNNVSEH